MHGLKRLSSPLNLLLPTIVLGATSLFGCLQTVATQNVDGGTDGGIGHPGPDGGSSDAGADGGADGGGTVHAELGCRGLPAPTGTIVHVNPGDDLPAAVRNAASGTTLLLENGTYPISAPLVFLNPHVTLRSASDDRTKVTIDGQYLVDETAVWADDIFIANLTLRRFGNHPIHAAAYGGHGLENFHMYGVRIEDGGQQFVKVNGDNPNDPSTAHWVDHGVIECSEFVMTDQGRPHIKRDYGLCYTGGIDVHGGLGWIVRWNHFEGIYCDDGVTAEHAVHFWSGSRDTITEDNVIVNCSRGVGYGLGQDSARTYPDWPPTGVVSHYGGIIRNNLVYAMVWQFEAGIGLEQADGPRVYHNTVVYQSADGRFQTGIDTVYDNTNATIRNNITTRRTNRGGTQVADHNLEGPPLSIFVDAGNGNFHLTSAGASTAGLGVPLGSAAGLDLDGWPHDAPSLGAYEYRP